MNNLLLTITLALPALFSIPMMAATEYTGPQSVPQAAPSYYAPKNIEELHSVMVRLTRQDGNPLCTATYIGHNLLLSAAHCVINPMDHIPNDAFFAGEKLEVLVVDTLRDISILGTKQVNANFMTLEDRDAKIMFKASFISCGYGGGVMMCSNPGMFFPENMPMMSIYNVTSNIRPLVGGMSGGPVIDTITGKIVGVNHAGYTDEAGSNLAGLGFFIPVPVIHQVLDKLGMSIDRLDTLFGTGKIKLLPRKVPAMSNPGTPSTRRPGQRRPPVLPPPTSSAKGCN